MKKEQKIVTKKRYLKQTFEVITPLDTVIDEESLQKDYKGNIEELAKEFYKEEGIWWSEKLKLIKAEIIN